jgi:hypothetical protein
MAQPLDHNTASTTYQPGYPSAVTLADVSPPTDYPRHFNTPVEAFPIQDSPTNPFHPPVCLKSHWDPTMIYQKTVPAQHVNLPLAFRPWTRICMNYTTTGPVERLPQVPDALVFPSGGDVYPPQRWSEHIDSESLTRRLDRPLGTCEDSQYVPKNSSDMFQQRVLIPDRAQPNTQFMSELAMPRALLRTAPYECRKEVDQMNWEFSPRLFNNPTKQDRYHKSARANKSVWADPARCSSPL